MTQHLTTGRRGEEITADYLKKKGYKILAMNWKLAHVPAAGELDIVAKRGEDLIFVEVKAMSANDVFYPEDHFTSAKARKTLRAARLWLAENKQFDKPWQIDLVAVSFGAGGAHEVVQYEQVVTG